MELLLHTATLLGCDGQWNSFYLLQWNPCWTVVPHDDALIFARAPPSHG